MTQRYKAVIAGLGNIAWRFDGHKAGFLSPRTHALSYTHNERTFLVGGCSPDENDRREFENRFHVPSFPQFEDLIDSTQPDIVSICSPSEKHFQQALYCIEKKIPMIWLEKPPALSLQELDLLINRQSLCGHQSAILVNYQRRYTESYERLKSIYEKGRFGKCVMIQMNYSRGLETNGSHLIDMLFYIAGADLDFEIDSMAANPEAQNPSFLLQLNNGIAVTVSGMDLPYHCIDIAFIFESGRISVFYGGATMAIEEKVENEEYPGFHRLRSKKTIHFKQGGFQGSMDRALSDLIASYEAKSPPASNLVSARKAQAVMHQVREKQKAFRL